MNFEVNVGVNLGGILQRPAAEHKREFAGFPWFLAVLHSHAPPLFDRVCASCNDRFDESFVKNLIDAERCIVSPARDTALRDGPAERAAPLAESLRHLASFKFVLFVSGVETFRDFGGGSCSKDFEVGLEKGTETRNDV